MKTRFPGKTNKSHSTSNGDYTKNDSEKAEILNSFFQSVLTEEDTSNLPFDSNRSNNKILGKLLNTLSTNS